MEGAMASIFVWLRYSSARHLTWQRNYNTQPRILGEAQAKLTHKIAEVVFLHPCQQPTALIQEVELIMQAMGSCRVTDLDCSKHWPLSVM